MKHGGPSLKTEAGSGREEPLYLQTILWEKNVKKKKGKKGKLKQNDVRFVD